MKKAVVAFIFFHIIFLSVKAQYNQVWVFGDSCGISFNQNVNGEFQTSCFDSKLTILGAHVSMSKKNQLLFTVNPNTLQQADRYQVYNKNFDIMENGDSILTFTQVLNGINIIPSSLDSNKFFIFHRSFGPSKELYSVVDMSYNNGLGKITKKNTDLGLYHQPYNFMVERAWIKHANGRDWWLLLHPFLSDEFQAYLFANDTLTFQHRQYIGPFMGTTESPGWMAVSPDGSKIANCSIFGQLYLYDFDRCSGNLSNYKSIQQNSTSIFLSCEFSKKGILYLTKNSSLYQLNVNDENPQLVEIWNRYERDGCLFRMKLGPDDKIYVASSALLNQQCFSSNPNRPYMIENTHLSVIEKPDELGFACQFVPYKIPTCNKRTLGSLPNSPHYDLGALAGSGCDTIWPGHNDKENSLYFHLYPNPSQNEVQINCGNCGYDESKNYFMHDAAGRRVLAGTFTGRTLELTLENLQRGVYFLELRYNNQKEVKKIIKI